MSKSSVSSVIRLRGVRHNNLKNFDLDLPLKQLIVITGLSGSGKSSLAFDTLYAEGQRRYIETFSPYARQFFDRMDKPAVDSIEGIPPAIAIEQRNSVRTTRSTVGTMTEICDHMKLLWPQIAQLHCRGCGQPVRKDSPQSIWETVYKSGVRSPRSEIDSRTAVLVTFDLPLSEKLSVAESLALIAKQGYQRLLVGDEIVRLDEVTGRLAAGEWPSAITVVQDRVKLAPANRARFVEACEQAYYFGKGKLAVHVFAAAQDLMEYATGKTHQESRTRTREDNDERTAGCHVSPLTSHLFSSRLHCAACDIEYREPSSALFSFNHPVGACPACKGFGRAITIDYDLAIPDRAKTLVQGAVRPWQTGVSAECQEDLVTFAKRRNVPLDVPFEKLPRRWQDWVIQGDIDYGKDDAHRWPRAWYGVKGYFDWLESKAYKMHVRVLLSRYRAYTPCPACRGARFRPETLLYRLAIENFQFQRERRSDIRSTRKSGPIDSSPSPISLAEFYALTIREARQLIERLAVERKAKPTAPLGLILQEIRSRLAYLDDIGLGYLTLDRPTRTLSGGETERVNLTTCLGTRLVNTLFVLDEPSVGLHARDTDRLVRILEQLRDAGNTVVVVEHEASVMRAADELVDLGPGHGATGGAVVFQGSLAGLRKSNLSLTGQYLSGRKRIAIPTRRPVRLASRRQATSGTNRVNAGQRTQSLRIENATRYNLRHLNVEIPLNRFVCVTGVSGSGKSTLIREILYPTLAANLRSRISDLRTEPSKADRRTEDEDEDEKGGSGDPQPATRLAGHEHLGRAVFVDQSLLGKTPRSNPAVYIGAFGDIRELFAQSEAAKQRGFNTSAFSFNSSQGQCERCRGAGFEKIEMQFLSDVFIRCPDCDGRRYRRHILEVKISPKSEVRSLKSGIQAPGGEGTSLKSESGNGWSIADLLEATVEESTAFLLGFPDSRPAQRAVVGLKLLEEVGLGYLRVGQPINTLSGGESQRLKLVRHLAEATANPKPEARDPKTEGSSASSTDFKAGTSDLSRPTLFLFDEPTTGLHFDDVRVLLQVFQRLVDAGHSLIVIEHNLDVIKCADWVIDLGPEAGAAGGQLVVAGTPEEVAECPMSHTGCFLRGVLAGRQGRGDLEPPLVARGRKRPDQDPRRVRPQRDAGGVDVDRSHHDSARFKTT